MNIIKAERLFAAGGERLRLNSVLVFTYIYFSVPSVVSVVEVLLGICR
jgi:hypothetical protein